MSIEELYKVYLDHPVVCTDTRKLSAGCLFFALKGENFNGNLFAVKAIEQGAAFAVVDEDCGNDERLIRVDDVLKTLQDLSTYHRLQLSIPVHVIGGSNGKTTTKELTAAVLSKKYNTLHTPGNFNNHIGVPLTLLMLNKHHQLAVVELGANHKGENALLCEIVQPDTGLVTNAGKDHLEGFGGIEGVREANAEVYTYLKNKNGLVFLQHDNPDLKTMLGNYSNVLRYGSSEECKVCGSAEINNGYLQVNMTAPFHATLQTQLAGTYNLENVLAAVAAGIHFGVAQQDITDAIKNYSPGNQRSQLLQKEGITVILDAYNANPSSMEAALQNFGKAYTEPRMIALGEMLELGDAAATEHASIARLAASGKPELLILVGELFKKSADDLNALYFPDSTAATQWFRHHKPATGSLLIKGSRGTRMEKLMEAF